MSSDAIQEQREGCLLLGLLTLVATAVFSYGFVLFGQWRCLMYSPQHQHAKEVMYVCFTLVLLGSLLNGVGAYLDRARAFAAMQRGLAEVVTLDLRSPGTLLQLCSLVLGLIASLVFSQFLRNVATCFQDQARIRNVDFNLGFVGLLLGGSVGAVLYAARLSLLTRFLPWLAAGWLFCFLWHLYLVASVCCCVENHLNRGAAVEGKWIRQHEGSVALHTLSGLHRMVKRVQD